MIGADEEDPDGTEQRKTVEYDHIDLDAIVRAADGRSVTAARLRGDEQHFPDCRPFLLREQQPHHLILLTSSGWAFRAEGSVAKGDTPGLRTTHTELSTYGLGGVAICTAEELLVVVADDFCEVPYTSLRGLVRAMDHVELHAAGNKDYVLDVAESADRYEVAVAVDYLRRKLRAAGRR